MNSETLIPPVDTLLPHRGEMLLIDRIEQVDPEHLHAQARVRRDQWYSDAEGNMPAWIGVELMAQAIAAHVGYWKWKRGRPVEMGFLLGTRTYKSAVAAYPADAVLDVKATLLYREESGLGAFECVVVLDGEQVAEAAVKVFEPEDPARFMRELDA